MNSDCKILTEEEEELVDTTRYNFRRWTSEELQKKQSPFERGTRKEFPFLFQKKKFSERKDTKTSLEDICAQLKDVDVNTNIDVNVDVNVDVNEYKSLTPPYPPYSTTPLLTVSEITTDISNNLLQL